jgi:hypothetical protein
MGPNAHDSQESLDVPNNGTENSPLVEKNYGSTSFQVPVKEKESSNAKRVLVKTQSSFWEDASQFNEGSIPHSIVLAFVIGVVCGTASFVYYKILFWVLEFVWHTLPELVVVDKWPEWAYVLWIPLVGFTMALGVGSTVAFMGEPGDLASTIKCVHDKAYVAMSHVMPMVRAVGFVLTDPCPSIVFHPGPNL